MLGSMRPPFSVSSNEQPAIRINLSAFSDFGTLGLIHGANKVCTAASCVRDDLGLRVSVGIAVNWKSPFGPVEIDFGYPILKQSYDKPQAIRLSAGTQF